MRVMKVGEIAAWPCGCQIQRIGETLERAVHACASHPKYYGLEWQGLRLTEVYEYDARADEGHGLTSGPRLLDPLAIVLASEL